MVITYFQEQISGNLNYDDKVYALSPLGKDFCMIYEIDFSQFPPDHPADFKEQERKKGSDMESNLLSAETRVRLLVAYTAGAEAGALALGFTNMTLYVQSAIGETNQSYINSNISHRVELAASIRVNYVETSSQSTDLSRFRNTSDGFMDEVHIYRSMYSADVCVLIVDNAENCGLASGISSTSSTAFCVAHFDCVLGNYTFGHEIAHLHGCRHNQQDDPNNSPFAYGHGYCFPAGGWRTIMAVNQTCDDANLTRIQHYSNPFVNFGGAATGTSATNDNASVLNQTVETIAGFSVATGIISLTSAHSLVDEEMGTAIATEKIVLSPGFTVLTNSEFRAKISSTDAVSRIASQGNKVNEIRNALDYTEINNVEKDGISIYPNPANDNLSIKGKLDKQQSSVQIHLYDMYGNVLQEAYLKNISELDYVLSTERINSGIYLLTIEMNHKIFKHKVVIK